MPYSGAIPIHAPSPTTMNPLTGATVGGFSFGKSFLRILKGAHAQLLPVVCRAVPCCIAVMSCYTLSFLMYYPVLIREFAHTRPTTALHNTASRRNVSTVLCVERKWRRSRMAGRHGPKDRGLTQLLKALQRARQPVERQRRSRLPTAAERPMSVQADPESTLIRIPHLDGTGR